MSANDTQVGGDHYRKLKIQPWDFIAANGIGYLEGSAIVYIARWKDKGGVEDLKKARHYLDKLIEIQGTPDPAKTYTLLDLIGPLTAIEGERTEAIDPMNNYHWCVLPTGWVGFVFDGVADDKEMFKCRTCRERFTVNVGQMPHNHHRCNIVADPDHQTC